MMRTRPILLSATMLLVALTGCDGASPSMSREEFAQADSNHDGKLSKEEYQRVYAIRAAGGDAKAAQTVKSNLKYDTYGTRFKNADSNGDGYISDAELGLK